MKISTEWEKLPSFVSSIAPKSHYFLLYPLNENRYDLTAYTVYHGCYKIIWIAYGYIWHNYLRQTQRKVEFHVSSLKNPKLLERISFDFPTK